MFLYSTIEEWVIVEPSMFPVDQTNYDSDFLNVIKDSLTTQFVNKILADVGLILMIKEIVKVRDAHILPNEGVTRVKVEFITISFTPFVGEILEGTIYESDQSGVAIDLGIFNDIKIPRANLRRVSKWDTEEKTWVWLYKDHHGIETRLPYHKYSHVRFKVLEVRYNTKAKEGVPMLIVGTFNRTGLGLKSWWTDN